MKISILTLFPEMFKGPFDYSIIKKAIDKKIVNINFVNIRNFGEGTHKIVDDKPYGGGKGMILRVDVVHNAISILRQAQDKNKKLNIKDQKVILLTPEGITFNQSIAKRFSKLKHLILVCGHYEGFDKRVDKFVDQKLSIGDFIVTGGEIPAMLVTDAVTRLIKGVLKEEVTNKESFSLPAGRQDPLLEYPQYTKPRRYKNLHVPRILLTGDHKKIDDWQNKQSIKNTFKARPDLLVKRKG